MYVCIFIMYVCILIFIKLHIITAQSGPVIRVIMYVRIYVCIFIKLHIITAQSGLLDILVILCHLLR